MMMITRRMMILLIAKALSGLRRAQSQAGFNQTKQNGALCACACTSKHICKSKPSIGGEKQMLEYK
eukprot:7864404-Ditylum_brightwellii.AAC.1